MMLSSLRNSRVALVGGGGFVGDSLSAYLEDQSCIHCVIDTSHSTKAEKYIYRTDYIANICNEEDICKIFREFLPDIVVHLASYGMSGPAMLDPICYAINYGGTQNLISACRRFNVRGLIYASTYNVIFGGQHIDGGCEKTTYFLGKHSDQYAPSKTLAEKLVIACNCAKTNNGSSLMTCSLRLCAIYGPGEKRHFPRIVSVMDSGLYLMKIGDAIVDWIHIDNVVQAFVRSIHQISKHSQSPDLCPIAGKAYFISDGTPISQNKFLEPLCEARGLYIPTITLPGWIVMYAAFVMEQIHYLGQFTKLYSYSPFLTQAEVAKVAVTHYFSIDNARRDMNYAPTITTEEGARQMADFYRENLSNKNYFRLVDPLVGILIMIGMLLLSHFALQPEDTEYSSTLFQELKKLSYFLFRTRFNLQVLLFGAHLAHLYEASVALNLCRKVLKCSIWNTYAWCIQTSIFGYGSLGLLYSRVEFMKNRSVQ